MEAYIVLMDRKKGLSEIVSTVRDENLADLSPLLTFRSLYKKTIASEEPVTPVGLFSRAPKLPCD